MTDRLPTEPCDLDAVDARRLLASGELSAVELLTSCLARTDRVDPAVNAMVTRCDERAMAEAEAADRAFAGGRDEGTEPLGPLHGLPVAIKDLQATEGVRTTLGAAAFADNVPAADAGIVARVRAAGGIVVGKTNIPERSIGANTVNRLFGATGNPFDPTKSCGGSSGGSAVALATGMAPLATGSDHGGSLRIPACYCGVVGHRATPGVVPFDERATTQTFYSVQGPMGRTVADTALLLSVVADRDLAASKVDGRLRHDPMAFPLDAPALAELPPVELGSLRVGVTEDLGGVMVSESIRRSFRGRVEALADVVADIREVPVDLRDGSDVDWRLRADVFVTQYHAEAQDWDDGFNPNIRASYDSALETPMEDIALARRRQMDLCGHMAGLFRSRFNPDGVDLIVCPGVSVSPFPWAELFPRTVDGAPVDNYMAWLSLTAALTVVGHPVTAVPAGLDDQAMPFGLQLVGPRYGDRHLLSMAAAVEQWLNAETDTGRPSPDLDGLVRSGVELVEAGKRSLAD